MKLEERKRKRNLRKIINDKRRLRKLMQYRK